MNTFFSEIARMELNTRKRKKRLVRNLTEVNIITFHHFEEHSRNLTLMGKEVKKKGESLFRLSLSIVFPRFLPLAKNVTNHMTNQQKFCRKVFKILTSV